MDNLGGAERSLVDFLDQWRAAVPGLELFVISRAPEGHLQRELDRRGIPWMNLAFHSLVRHRRATTPAEIYSSARDDFAAVRAIERFITEFGAELVVTNTIVAPWAALAAKLVGVPHVWFAREFGDGHEFQIPRDDVFSDIGLLSDLVVTNSRTLREFLSEWIDPAKIAVLYPRLEATTPGGESNAAGWPFASTDPDALRLVCVGRIAESKGQARLVRAAAQLKREGVAVEVALVGSATDEDRRRIEELIGELAVDDRVALTGESSNPSAYVTAADAGVVVSDSEGFGRVTVEYMAADRPVVGAATGATVELVEHGVTGLLFEPGDVASLAEAIRSYALDRAKVSRHGAAAGRALREDIVARHTLADLLPRLTSVVKDGSAPLTTLPKVFASWMTLPATTFDLLVSSGSMVDPRTSRTWRIGDLALAAPRKAAALLRRAGVRA
ncbi:glycosyltransferase family 4 protein [Salinibacterium sp. SYSU T00001]|uniref:glycosyltransferase family 4 protein n=1 Tax=Homoserinimonas sedimenticola TaxID=2986805 RepID=UPI0022355B09|nr:glycosyltransferase family 4 protein [Salinibacterium sedimenticola]MCW4385047.1 glycosyltransferase family 4 protein [Salinibacterium sedimenticola]